MNIIKLNAINSTNDYLKELLANQDAENFTVVTAENQTGGRGQMGAVWAVEAGKNLTFSVLVKDLLRDINGIFSLNVAVAVAIAKALVSTGITGISIKWPNDILAGNKKLGGILIENIIKSNGGIQSVIGIGVNVNQRNFDGLPKATSLGVVNGKEFDKEMVMFSILDCVKQELLNLVNNDAQAIWDEYHEFLFKKGVPMPFEQNGAKFMGIIKGIMPDGRLQVLLEDDTMTEFGIKEIQLLY